MSQLSRSLRVFGVFALVSVCWCVTASAQEIKTVFVIAMENHNWTQPANQFTGGIQQIYQNPAAPFINSLVNGTAAAVVGNRIVNISEQVSYARNYRNVISAREGLMVAIRRIRQTLWSARDGASSRARCQFPYSFFFEIPGHAISRLS